MGALWGVGHTVSLLAVGMVLAVVGAQMPARLSGLFDLMVASMLVLVGLSSLRRGLSRARAGSPAPPARRSLLIGVAHGLAGSGSVTALVVANLSSLPARLTYMALFGGGLIVGMAVLSGIAGWPLARLSRHPWAGQAVAGAAGLVSLALGMVWGYPLLAGFVR